MTSDSELKQNFPRTFAFGITLLKNIQIWEDVQFVCLCHSPEHIYAKLDFNNYYTAMKTKYRNQLNTAPGMRIHFSSIKPNIKRLTL